MAESQLIWLLFTPHCFDLFTQFSVKEFIDDGCAVSIISKALGYAIICGSFALKLPQILKIVNAKSGAGLSVISLVIESLGFLVTTAYFYRQGYPASTYGESPIIFTQNMIIIALICAYNSQLTLGALFVVAYSAFFVVSMTEYLPMIVLQQIYASNLFIILGSRLPQIYAIFKLKSTGNNAFITWFLNFGGSLARLFTTMQEVEDTMALVLICLSVVCNGIIVLQFILYWNASDEIKKKKE
uniref:Mannose-P-dolichol utilization defect 1 protein homolog n=1 Tax=Elphidium margaritaceum TaxID=933848 RepID=A0A7S0XRP0_9EUKA|eukprot:CAMPEP_0202712538 /NCGR_PEP_ID=MMETSP1385-20130828/42484_1 /ASSEMBLY_ACC=CAM_ASM_000861 /TAXON_ID=933848 /ORGANISM="Elphidium margaritaceum" /LENGTH=241 /DNA_ID=CAMNT_0049372609 /DNA_START=34 /DNA_END=759 /DNA_ORIENTATION=+